MLKSEEGEKAKINVPIEEGSSEHKEKRPKSEDVEQKPKEEAGDEEESKDKGNDSEELGSDLDSDAEEETGEKEKEDAFANKIICMYDKVHRARTRWRCNFIMVVAHIDGRDYLFHKLNGDFEW
jgi:transcription initiation factor TFIIA large subunit